MKKVTYATRLTGVGDASGEDLGMVVDAWILRI